MTWLPEANWTNQSKIVPPQNQHPVPVWLARKNTTWRKVVSPPLPEEGLLRHRHRVAWLDSPRSPIPSSWKVNTSFKRIFCSHRASLVPPMIAIGKLSRDENWVLGGCRWKTCDIQTSAISGLVLLEAKRATSVDILYIFERWSRVTATHIHSYRNRSRSVMSGSFLEEKKSVWDKLTRTLTEAFKSNQDCRK